jgi:hypothetical protein
MTVERALAKLTLSKESKSEKVSEKEKDIKDTSSSNGDAPPTYEEQQQQLEDEQFVIDIPPLNFPDPGLAEQTTVEKDRCILHLKLLASLADLRETISTIDGLFGIHDSQAFKFEEEARSKALIRIREKRWAVYTARAVDRYADWWTHCVPVSEAFPTIYSVQSKSYTALTSTYPSTWLAKNLPPLGKRCSHDRLKLILTCGLQMFSWSGMLTCSILATILRIASEEAECAPGLLISLGN